MKTFNLAAPLNSRARVFTLDSKCPSKPGLSARKATPAAKN
jgi:hypothetical protein